MRIQEGTTTFVVVVAWKLDVGRRTWMRERDEQGFL